MNKIKTVKIKNEDGSVDKEAFHISADARNIDMTNGYNVQETIGTIDVNEDGSVAEQLNSIDNSIDNIEIDIKKKAYFFDTVADMKAANLKIGDYACTLGYYEINDGGAAEYKIKESDNKYCEILVNGLVAKLNVKNDINVKQLGAHADGLTDDANILQYAFNNYRKIYIPLGTYLINSTIIIKEGKTVYGDGMFATSIKYLGNNSAIKIENNYFGITSIENLSILRGSAYADEDVSSVGIEIGYTTRGVSNLFCHKIAVRYFYRNLQCSHAGALLNSVFEECLFQQGYINAIIIGGFNNYFNKCQFTNAKSVGYIQQSGEGRFKECLFESNVRAVEIRPSGGSYSFDSCFFENTNKTEESNYSLIHITSSNLTSVEDLECINCHFYGSWKQVYLRQVKKATFIGNHMANAGSFCIGYADNNTIEDITLIGNVFNILPDLSKSYIHLIEKDVYDTGWISIDTSSETLGRIIDLKIRKIGKIVKMRGTITGVVDSDIGSLFSTKIPEEFRPANSTYCICTAYSGSSTNVDTCGNIRIYSTGSIQYCGIKASSSNINSLLLDTVQYFID